MVHDELLHVRQQTVTIDNQEHIYIPGMPRGTWGGILFA
jgi:hypothetical protein